MASQNKRRYMDGCFCGDWVDVEVNQATERPMACSERKRKDLQTLLDELEVIKQNLEHINEKKQMLDDLMRFNRGELAES